MSNTNISANMALPIPVVGVDTGPNWALNIDACLALIDLHDHSSGKGVQIGTAGLNIDGDFSIGNNNLLNVNSMRLASQSAVLAGGSDLRCVYAVGVNLYYNDGNGNQIQITSGGGVAGSPGSISNLTSPASASYVALSETFVWQSDSNIAADMDMRSVILRNSTASSKGMTLSPPAAMASDFEVTFPALPAAQRFMTLDNVGSIAASWVTDNVTTEISSSNLQVKDLGISTAKIAANAVTLPKLAVPLVHTSSSSGSFNASSTSFADISNLTVTFTSLARPVMIGIQSSGNDAMSFGITCTANQVANFEGIATFQVLRDSTVVYSWIVKLECQLQSVSQRNTLLINAPMGIIDSTSTAGTHTWKVQYKVNDSDYIALAQNCTLTILEM